MGGFDDREAYIESGSSQCETGACLVYRLRGDPSNTCPDSGPTSGPADATTDQCTPASEVKERVYCSCRCDAPAGDPKGFCACPENFSCVPTLDDGPIGIRGSYCVRNGTLATL